MVGLLRDRPCRGAAHGTGSCAGNFAAPGLDHLVRIVKRKLKKIQYRPRLITGCLTPAGVTIEAS